MDIEQIFQEYQIYNHLLAFLVGMPRIFMILQTVPFMGATIITGQIRFVVAFSFYLVLHPMIFAVFSGQDVFMSSNLLYYGAILIKEIFLGFILGWLAGLAFWAIQSAGFLVDNQRGAAQATESDPLSGEQTSPLGSLLFQGMTYMFFSTGAALSFIGVIYASYEIWPVASFFPTSVFSDSRLVLFFGGKVAHLATQFILIAGPIVVACLLTDISLGLVNRFASQLNVYVLSMPIKSAVAALLIFIYFNSLMADSCGMFNEFKADMYFLRDLIP